ncbi:MAG TPA: SH3 domain-containing protein [Reyranella sp.]|nr:SH3 domain-containing protein [Reyranella sp.]
MRIRSAILATSVTLILLPAISLPSRATEPPGNPAIYRGSGLPIPRFASLKSDEVNVRTGPGARYPVDWVFKRKGMPVEIVAEFENWRKIRDWQGASGWVYQALLTGKRSFIIPSKPVSLHRTPTLSAEVVAKLEPEVTGEIRSCQGDWCRVTAQGVSGWLERTDFWGVYKAEPIN